MLDRDAAARVAPTLMFQDLARTKDTAAPSDVAVVLPTTLRPSLARAIGSVYAQDFAGRIQLLVGIDVALGERALLDGLAAAAPSRVTLTVCALPYSTSVRHGGLYPNRYGGALRSILTLAAGSRLVAYLDDDNWWAPGHLSSLASSLADAEWAFSQRIFADPETGEAICLDDWESVGPGAGVFAEAFGGFVDPSSLMVDKLACHEATGLWSLAAFEDGSGEDRLVFEALARRHRWRATGLPTSHYAMHERDRNHPARLQRLRERGITLPAERRAGTLPLASVTAGLRRGSGPDEATPPADRVLVELLARLKPRETVLLGGPAAAAASLAAALDRLGLAGEVLRAADDAGSAGHRSALGAGIALLDQAPAAAAEALGRRRVAVDLVRLERAGTQAEIAQAFALLRRGGILLGPGPAPPDVEAVARACGAETLQAEIDGAAYWLVQKG